MQCCSPFQLVSGQNIDHTFDHVIGYSGDRGRLLGVIRPAWRKVLESETRLNWLKKMVNRKLVVRDIEAFSKAQSDMLRSD